MSPRKNDTPRATQSSTAATSRILLLVLVDYALLAEGSVRVIAVQLYSLTLGVRAELATIAATAHILSVLTTIAC